MRAAEVIDVLEARVGAAESYRVSEGGDLMGAKQTNKHWAQSEGSWRQQQSKQLKERG